MEARAGVDAVIFDYGGVVRREDAAEFDEFAARHGLPPGTLWAAFHDIPEYGPSRTGRLSADGYRAGVLRALARLLPEDSARCALAEWDDLKSFDAMRRQNSRTTSMAAFIGIRELR